MMIGDAFVHVYCDGEDCSEKIEIGLSGGYGNWNEFKLRNDLRDLGWYCNVEDDRHLCDQCNNDKYEETH